MPTNVLIAGGGPAALEAALVLHRVAGGAVATTVLTPETDFVYRPLSVLSPFAAGHATSYPLARIAADAQFTLRPGRVAAVEPAAHLVRTDAGDAIPYDVLLVATGACNVAPFDAGVTFEGGPKDQERVHGLVQDLEMGYVKRVTFVVPAGVTWPLPLYELALRAAHRAFEMGSEVDVHLVTPEQAPLAIFGTAASGEVAELLALAGITVHAGVRAQVPERSVVVLPETGERIEDTRIVAIPVLAGPSIPGLPADRGGFLEVDRAGRVLGVPDVYAAGDVTDFPIKQGGLACQQADAAAEAIAHRAGAPVEPVPFTPVLRGMLLTERWSRFLRRDAKEEGGGHWAERALWWPPTKIAGRELAGYLEAIDEELGRTDGGLRVRVHMDEGGADARQVEILSLLGAR
jgi:sulfide:quinone oxidoreductase